MPHTRITAEAAEHLLALDVPLTVLDARDPQAFARDRLDGAQLITRDSLTTLLLQSPKDRPVLIYCYHGNASQTYAAMFADFRFEQVFDLIGGWAAWEQHLAAPAPASPPSMSEWLRARGYRGDAIDETIGNRTTPLMQAAREGDAAAVQALLQAGANLHAENADGNQALWLACFAESPQPLDLLIDSGARVDHQNHHGSSCLMYAASSGKVEVARRLLKAGASVALRSLDDYTALDMASTLECLRLLREAERRALERMPHAVASSPPEGAHPAGVSSKR